MANSAPRKSRLKFCLFRNCNTKSKECPDITFFSFPRPCMKVRRKQVVADISHVKSCSACEKCSKWISMCRINSLYYSEQLIPLKKAKDLDICSLHFVNGHPYSTKFPDPLPAKTVLDIKSLKYSPNTLWPKLSMLRSMLHLKENIDVKMFDEVEAFVKNKNKGYVPKKSEVLSREQLKKFLREAPNDIFLMYKSTIHKRKALPDLLEAAEGSSSQSNAKKIKSELIEHIEVDDLSLKVEDGSHIEIINDRLMNSIEMLEDVPARIKQEGIEDPLEIYPPELSPLEFNVEEENPFADDKCEGLMNELEVDYPLKFGIKEENLPSLPPISNSNMTTLTQNKFECNQIHKETQTIPTRSKLQELERENEHLKLEVARLRRVLKARAKQCSVCESMLC